MFLQHKLMEYYEDTTDYSTVIAYAFTQYSLKRGIKNLGKVGDGSNRETVSAPQKGYIPYQIIQISD